MDLDLLPVVTTPHNVLLVDPLGKPVLTFTTSRPDYRALDYLQAACDSVGFTFLDVAIFQYSTVIVTVTMTPCGCGRKYAQHHLCPVCGDWICIFCQGSHICDGEYLDAGGSL